MTNSAVTKPISAANNCWRLSPSISAGHRKSPNQIREAGLGRRRDGPSEFTPKTALTGLVAVIHVLRRPPFIMAGRTKTALTGLVPVIHVLQRPRIIARKTWMPGTRPGTVSVGWRKSADTATARGGHDGQ